MTWLYDWYLLVRNTSQSWPPMMSNIEKDTKQMVSTTTAFLYVLQVKLDGVHAHVASLTWVRLGRDEREREAGHGEDEDDRVGAEQLKTTQKKKSIRNNKQGRMKKTAMKKTAIHPCFENPSHPLALNSRWVTHMPAPLSLTRIALALDLELERTPLPQLKRPTSHTLSRATQTYLPPVGAKHASGDEYGFAVPGQGVGM
ncbi:hypothetical protein DEU56DRAFT_760326 [Suillus clintonianus]|uniref:uncharacterized protein n=1 Tax=Suillus clintonianus TaxID=1904413 RepID=UPI001B87DDD9|nr:uncharacterized protein DEU56DRAFT_760326 [Suillus clintonianus]KAG2122469.1 hypothetical protein DEU56DRAFT_760326 [Suillus clintonianus]